MIVARRRGKIDLPLICHLTVKFKKNRTNVYFNSKYNFVILYMAQIYICMYIYIYIYYYYYY